MFKIQKKAEHSSRPLKPVSRYVTHDEPLPTEYVLPLLFCRYHMTWPVCLSLIEFTLSAEISSNPLEIAD